MKAIVAADRHVSRLQQDTVAHGKAGFKTAIDTEIDFQHTGLCTDFCIRLHFQPQQHNAHAVKKPVIVDLSVTVRIFKAAHLSGEAGCNTRFVMKNDVNHVVFLMEPPQSACLSFGR